MSWIAITAIAVLAAILLAYGLCELAVRLLNGARDKDSTRR